MSLRRRAALAACPLLLLAAPPAGAQPPFEGVITMRMRAGPVPEPIVVRYLVREGRLRSEMDTPNGMRIATIVDHGKREIYVLMPAQRMYMAMPIADGGGAAADAAGREVKLAKTGRVETVAGHRCEHYLVAAAERSMDVCVATDLPAMAIGGAMGGAGPGSTSPEWARALGRQPGFPLKVTLRGDADATLEVTAIERRTLDPALFAPPADYRRMDVPAGGPRRPPGGR